VFRSTVALQTKLSKRSLKTLENDRVPSVSTNSLKGTPVDNLFGQIAVGTWMGTVDVAPSKALTTTQTSVGASRRFEAAETDRLNEAHWEPVSENIVDAMELDLRILQQRCRHEAVNNPVLDSGIETQQTNVVGRTGPRLQVLTENAAFNDLAEALFREWSESCEYQDNLSMMDLVEGWTAQWAFNGEILLQEIVGRTVSDYRLHDVGSESFDWTLYQPNIFAGVEVDAAQRVVAYHICDPENTFEKQRLKKEFAIHVYRRRFAKQRRGLPSLASALPTSADTRDYDDQVMDAARAAADYSIIMVTDHPDADFQEPKKNEYHLRRRMQRYATPGWKPIEMRANQPTTTYRDFRKEKHTDLAGTVGEQPHMIFRRDASNHNMSSARFDGSRYSVAIDRFHSKLEKRCLAPIARRLIRIAQLTGLLPPTPVSKIAKKLQYEFPNILLPLAWEWPKQPPIDPLKDAMAQRIRLENGTLSLSQAIVEDGRRPEEVIKIRATDNANLKAAGLPPIVGAIPTDPALLQLALNDDDEDEPPQPKPQADTELPTQ
jgi:lambda family phage portal protein